MNEYINKLKIMSEYKNISKTDKQTILDNFYHQMTLNTQKNRN